MTIIEPPKHHVCEQPRDMGKRRMTSSIFRDGWAMVPIPVEHGTLWQCPGCQLWWVACPNPGNGHGIWFAHGGREWNRVVWWDFALRRRIRALEAK